jgi:P4 family phage/plasmid primase-like protien
MMVGKACLMHSSHSHTPEAPRLRFVIPLARAVSAAEYEPIARRLAEWLDIDAFDDTTYEASRLMYWGSCSKDATYVCRVFESDEWVDPDEVLATYEDWTDMRSWPTSTRQATAITKMGAVQGDPLAKPGVIGAFNRAYTITAAIEQFLPDVYERCEEGRWTYKNGSTTGGAVTYDNDTFIYSYHDTDPISRRLCSAFDLVRIHLYGNLDEGSEAEIGDLPSMNAMKNLCQNDEKVRKELAEGVLQTPESVFDRKTDLTRFTGDLTEIGLSVVLADTYGYGVMYNKAFGWLFWDGTRWVLDANAEANMLIIRFTDDLYRAARMKMQLATDKASQELAKREYTAACKIRSETGIRHLVALLKSIVNEPRAGSFDAEAWDLNTPDGIVDLRTGEIRAHDPKARCTKCTNVSPGSTGADQWFAFIDHVSNGDKGFADYLQMLAGMSAVGAVYEEGLVISYGPGGNGKSTFFGAISQVLGDYAKTVNADVLAPSWGRPDQSYIAALRGVRLAVLGETEDSAVMSSAALKRITSQDVISARALYKDPMEFIPTHTTIMHTNHLPRLTATDGGTKRRIAVAPFPATLPPDDIITDYQGVLFRECGPAILKWIIDGAIKFYQNKCKLPKPQCVMEATKKYLEDENWFGNFMADCCEEVPEATIRANEIYAAYQVWAGSNGIRCKSARDLSNALEAAGFSKSRTGSGNCWQGIKLKDVGM